MKKLTNIIITAILITILFVYSGCKNNEVNNNVFLKYLKETFNENDVKNEKMFILLPCSGCSGCEQSIYYIFTSHLLNNKKITLVST